MLSAEAFLLAQVKKQGELKKRTNLGRKWQFIPEKKLTKNENETWSLFYPTKYNEWYL